MGLYDGRHGGDEEASTAAVAKLLGLPVVLVVDASKASRSVGAMALGFKAFDPTLHLAGVILNGIAGDLHLELARPSLDRAGVRYLGYMPGRQEFTLPERHLGLIPTAEGRVAAAYYQHLAAQAAATVDLPAIVLSGGPMLNGWFRGERTGSGTIVWKARQMFATGEITYEQFVELVASSAPSPGHCNTMGTASTMNSLAEALGMSLPGCAAIPAPHKERAQIAYLTGKRIVDMVWEDLRPSKIMTREAFENVIVVNSAIGGSTNAPIHFNAIAKHIGVPLDNDDWEKVGYAIPLLVDMQPAGRYLGEEYHRAGGVPAVVNELMKAGKIHEHALTVNGRSMGENCAERPISDHDVIRPYKKPLKDKAGFLNLKGNLFDSAIMKTGVISEEFRARYLSNPRDPNAFEGRAIVFDGPEDYHKRIDDPALKIDQMCVLFMRGAGPVGYPGGAEVVNMRPPNYLIKKGITELACIGDGRQSGTSGSPSILNASPEAATGGGLAILKTGDRVRIDLNKRSADILISKEEYDKRRAALQGHGGYKYPGHQTPWQEIQRGIVDDFAHGMVLKPAVKYQKIAKTKGIPRDNH